ASWCQSAPTKSSSVSSRSQLYGMARSRWALITNLRVTVVAMSRCAPHYDAHRLQLCIQDGEVGVVAGADLPFAVAQPDGTCGDRRRHVAGVAQGCGA